MVSAVVSMNNIVSLSGGKDSTAMLLMMLERNEPIHSVVFFDTGWEFPGVLQHIEVLECQTGLKFIRLYPLIPFDFLMTDRPVRDKKTKQIKRYGYEWPSAMRRWCTREKMRAINYYLNLFDDAVVCVGYAKDETQRIKNNSRHTKRYPLIEYGITESEALKYCNDKGYYWFGLYEHFDRVSCFCCPLQKLSNIRILRKRYPAPWAKMLKMESLKKTNTTGFRGYKSVHDLDRRFAEEDKQTRLFK